MRGGVRACRREKHVSVLLLQALTNFDARLLVWAGCSALAHNDAVVALAPTFRPGSALSRSRVCLRYFTIARHASDESKSHDAGACQ